MQGYPSPASQPMPPPADPGTQPLGVRMENEPGAVTAMVLGILGLAVCGVLAPIAWTMGKKSVENIRREPGRWGGEGMAQAGYVLGIIGTILLVLAVIAIIIILSTGALMADRMR